MRKILFYSTRLALVLILITFNSHKVYGDEIESVLQTLESLQKDINTLENDYEKIKNFKFAYRLVENLLKYNLNRSDCVVAFASYLKLTTGITFVISKSITSGVTLTTL